MFLKEFYEVRDGGIAISAEQASMFAKEVAHDFNPLHDADAKRFCVPGDLLFSLVLEKYGLSQNMHFIFSGMVGHNVLLNFPETDAERFDVTDSQQDKTYLQIERSGDVIRDPSLIEALIRDYVAFSGQNFPYVLVPLLAKENVMFNIDRPLVIYESMTLHLDCMQFSEPRLEMLEPKMEVNGKRATAYLHFQICCGDAVVGSGFKKLAVSGLRDYEVEPMQAFVEEYLARKHGYLSNLAVAEVG
ncbi:DUF3581 domain-containing protein [Methylomonas sp. MED-D]|uniref:DUF3581 domain-containing protein n=1 Tax=Methylomonas koyamae TaxID=702114 RepID=A0A177N092_9GAMM|nr:MULTISPECIES: DUF3581 domain-containing protein [Methylomonas]MDT4328570.1 DUF3581 domain-containing protein [Methylomonas sp. MV1]OAI11312.1 hypothetical protein A1355_16155 [Methylomonas koyamae]WGS88194.1 DUF3581 domain-containing protein [Methylomonas sp. UP202]